MSAEFQTEQDRLIADLRATIAEQQGELEDLRANAESVTTSRRALLRGAGVVGGIAALAGVSQVAGKPQAAEAIEGHNARYKGGLSSFAKITGQKAGVIKGDVIQKGREGLIEVSYFQQKGTSPRDAASGLPTGKRSYAPLVLRKHTDNSSPILLNAFISNENLTQVLLNFWRVGLNGTEVNYYRIELANASIASFDTYQPDNDTLVNGTGPTVYLEEELSLVFQSITWTYVDGGITASDDWSSQA